MDLYELTKLASGGFAAVPASKLADLSMWCRDWCDETGDGRYCILSQTFEAIAVWWGEHDAYGGIPQPLAARLDQALQGALPGLLAEPDLTVAAHLASTLREQLLGLLLPVESWINTGDMKRGNGN